jgi:multidrug efflux system outer membrane protein
LSYEVDIFGRIRHQYGSARASYQAARADQKAVELSLTGEVAYNYFGLRSLDSQVAVLQKAVGLRQEAVKLNQERVTAGLANDVDLSRARVELDNTQADLDDTIRMRAETENNLAALCGLPASDFHITPKRLENLSVPLIPAGVPSELLVQRPDLIEAQYRVASASEQIGVARAAMLPTFNIQGQAGYESAKFNRLVEDQSHTWEVTGSVSVPIFEGG